MRILRISWMISRKSIEVMQVTRNDRVELASYQLKDVAHIWYTQWKDNRGTMRLLSLGIALVIIF